VTSRIIGHGRRFPLTVLSGGALDVPDPGQHGVHGGGHRLVQDLWVITLDGEHRRRTARTVALQQLTLRLFQGK
jgi:hypothetical protein